MISTTRITYELNRCTQIRYNLIELFMDASIWGYANRMYKSAKDVMTVYALEKALYNAVYYDFTETNIEDLIFKIREYLGMVNYVSKVDYFLARYPNIVCPINPDGPYIEDGDGEGNDVTNITNIINNYYPTTYITNKYTVVDDTQWHRQELTPLITVDGQTTIAGLEFNINEVDIDTLRLEVQGDDSHYTTTGIGYHIVGTTLHWHSFYDLKVGMQVTIKWREE